MTMSSIVVCEQTKATSKHQITIPRKIWGHLKLKAGTRFWVKLTDDNQITLEPKDDPIDLNQEEWETLYAITQEPKNVSKTFKSYKKAKKYLKAITNE